MKVIDLETWYRKEFFEFYSKNNICRFSITTPLDVTNLYNFVHRNKISFHFAMQHIFQTAINDIEEFNIRLENNKLIVTDAKYSSSPYLEKDAKLFKIVNTPYQNDIIKFCKNAKQICKTQKLFYDGLPLTEIQCLFSCVPWFECTNIENPKADYKDDFIPRIIWDKIKDEGGRKFVNVSIEANHRIIDGFLISQLVHKAKTLIENLQ